MRAALLTCVLLAVPYAAIAGDLHTAVRSGSVEDVRALLESGPWVTGSQEDARARDRVPVITPLEDAEVRGGTVQLFRYDAALKEVMGVGPCFG